MKLTLPLVVGAAVLVSSLAIARDGFSIFDAINQAVTTHPGVGEAAANRRATESELRQSQSTLLPQVRVEGRVGRGKWDYKDSIVPPQGNNRWQDQREASVVVRQLVFDGLTTINEIWRHAARVDASAYRVRERTELIALDAAEAYIDVHRYRRLIALADQNVAAHRALLSNVQARFQGGRAGEGDLEQVRERVEAAIAAQAQFRQQYDEARGVYRRAVGVEPFNIRPPSRLGGLPSSRDQALAVTLRSNPTIQAAQADRDAAKHGFDATAGAFMPTITLEGRALSGHNTATTFGDRTDVSGFVVASWDIFRGGQDSWRRVEMSERYQEQSMRHARLQRGAYESIDKAWAARTITSDRMAALMRQIAADQKVIVAYQKEYELGQRSLIDLLNAQNQLFNASVSLESTRGVAIFADYQLLAAMGKMLEYVKSPQPVDADPLPTRPFGLVPTKIWPILLKLPPGSEPLNIGKNTPNALETGVIVQTRTAAFDNRWSATAAAVDTVGKGSHTGQQWLAMAEATNGPKGVDAREQPSLEPAPGAPTPIMSFAPGPQLQPRGWLFPNTSRLFQ